MQRRIDITVPADRTDELIAALRGHDDLVGLSVLRGASLEPPGDVITIQTRNAGLHEILRELSRRNVGGSSSTSISTTEMKSLISPKVARAIGRERSELTWEEMENIIAKESNMTVNALLTMGVSGALAGVGLATDAVHYVIAAMVIAPGFEPISRTALGWLSRSVAWRRGLVQTLTGYAALAAGAAVAAIAMTLFGGGPLWPPAAYLPPGSLIDYWSSLSAPAVLVTTLAGAAGALLVATDRPVLTSGAMIALALIPAAALVGLGAVAADWSLLARGLLRWLLDVGLVLAGSALIFYWKRERVQRRGMMP